MKKDDCKKMYVNLSNETVDKLDYLAKKLGMSRSNLIAYYVGQGVNLELQKENLLTPTNMGVIINEVNKNQNDLEQFKIDDFIK